MNSSKRTKHPDVEREQAYLDHAYDCLARMREATVASLDTDAAANAVTRKALQEVLVGRLADLDRGGALCFGRIDEDAGETFYIGRRHVREENLEPVVIDWRAPVAEAFYQAGPDDPWGLERRRRFQIEDRRLLDIAEEIFVERGPRTDQVRPELMTAGDLLLAELARERTGQMRDIAATIQREQDALIRASAEGILVIEGAPGTGKTAVGLHRAAYLLYSLRGSLGRTGVLVVGPNPAFIRYIERVLPDLGETTVVQRAVNDLAGARIRADDDVETLRVKGDLRLAEVLKRGLRRRLRPPADAVEVTVGLREFLILPATVEQLVEEVSSIARSHRDGRALFAARLTAVPKSLEPSSRLGGEVVLAELLKAEEMEPILNRLWPFVSAGELVRETIRAPRVLDEIAEDILEPDERSLLTRQRGKPGPLTEEVWHTGDAQLLDEAQFLISGPPRTYGHVVVDEVQDLSPMQLRMVARRAPGGSLTLLGDLAQATGAWAHTDWNDLLRQLPSSVEPRRATLGFAYRTPRPIMVIAERLLEMIAPGTPAPEAVRPGGAPRVIQSDGMSVTSAVVGEMLRAERLPGTTAVIAPEELYEAIQTAARNSRVMFDTVRSSSGHALALITPREAKGLEFDQVIVVEPIALLVRGLEGLRQLYVAITRATQTLTIVHTGELPSVLASSSD